MVAECRLMVSGELERIGSVGTGLSRDSVCVAADTQVERKDPRSGNQHDASTALVVARLSDNDASDAGPGAHVGVRFRRVPRIPALVSILTDYSQVAYAGQRATTARVDFPRESFLQGPCFAVSSIAAMSQASSHSPIGPRSFPQAGTENVACPTMSILSP